MINYDWCAKAFRLHLMLPILGGLSFVATSFNEPKVRIIGHPLIVIDPGHGGHDHGARGSSTLEKDVNLNVALRLRDQILLQIPEARVMLTRESDEFLPLHERTAIANTHNADIFISLHCNSNRNGHVRGAETYIMGLHKSGQNLEVTAMENGNQEDTDLDQLSMEEIIIYNQLQDQNLAKSRELAMLFHEQFSGIHPGGSRTTRQAGFLVLWQAAMPSVLVEMGYINQPADELFLSSEQGQDIIAKSLTQSLQEYLILRSRELATASIQPDRSSGWRQ